MINMYKYLVSFEALNTSNSSDFFTRLFALFTVFFLPISNVGTNIFLSATFIFWLFSNYREKFFAACFNKVAISLFLMWLMALIGMFYTIGDEQDSYRILIKTSKIFIFPFFFTIFQDQELKLKAIKVLIFAICLSMLVIFLKQIDLIDYRLFHPNSSEGFKDRIFSGLYFILGLFFLCYEVKFFTGKFTFKNIINIVTCIIFMYFIFIINDARSTQAIFFAICLLLFGYFGNRISNKRKILLSTLIFSAMIYSATFGSMSQRLIETINNLNITSEDNYSYITEQQLDPRFAWYIEGTKIFLRQPWFGSGTGSVLNAYTLNNPILVTSNPHNQLLCQALQFGLLGILAYIFLIYSCFSEAFKLPDREKYYSIILTTSIMVGSLFNSWLLDYSSSMLFYILLGIVMSKIAEKNHDYA